VAVSKEVAVMTQTQNSITYFLIFALFASISLRLVLRTIWNRCSIYHKVISPV